MTSPLSAVSGAPWWFTLPTGGLLMAFLSGHIRPVVTWLVKRIFVSQESVETRESRLADISMKMVDQGQEDARDLRRDLVAARAEADTERKRADAERASGQHWYYTARAWEAKAHDVKHLAEQFRQICRSLRPTDPMSDIPPLPSLEDVNK